MYLDPATTRLLAAERVSRLHADATTTLADGSALPALASGSGIGSWGSDSASQGQQQQPSGRASRLSRRPASSVA